MQSLLADLHLHTVVSACAEIEMIPPLIVSRACELGLDLIAVTDHNCAANVQAVMQAAQDTELTVLPGMEVQTREEVHMLCLFDTWAQVELWEAEVSARLPGLKNREQVFGTQIVVDQTGEYLYTEERLLATSTSFSVEEVVQGVIDLGGICLPAHVDRPSYSLLSNLGFVPPGLPIAGLELSHLTTPRKFVESFPQLEQYGIIINGDAHRLAEMVALNRFSVQSPTVSELRLALAGQGGRSVEVIDPPPFISS
jgi:PHP family Zn ribbon phosphoesterase